MEAIEILLEHDTAGDPITGLKWTRKTTEKIAEVLQQIDIPVSAHTVARLLYQMNFYLRVNRKQIHPFAGQPQDNGLDLAEATVLDRR